MLDDFSALDFLSMDGFNLATIPSDMTPRKKKKRKTKARNKVGVSAKKRLAEILPMLSGRIGHKNQIQPNLQGWSMTLSWPTKETVPVDLWGDHGKHPLS